MPVYFDKTNERLILLNEKATPEFWDKVWGTGELKKTITRTRGRRMIKKTTKKYLVPSAKILEGGCGNGNTVFVLHDMGYDAYGVDTAGQTVRQIKEAVPSLNIFVQDVMDMEFPDNYFDGYWSLGVIEHFWNGYEDIAKEAQRVIKPGGYMFLTFPYMSPLRKLKAKLGQYELSKFETEPGNFYQFMLDKDSVIETLKKFGFSCVEKRPHDGSKGIKDEIGVIRPLMKKIYNAKSRPVKFINLVISTFFSPFAGHVILLVLQKQDNRH